MAQSTGNSNNTNMPPENGDKTNERNSPLALIEKQVVQVFIGQQDLGDTVNVWDREVSKETFEYLRQNNFLPNIPPNCNELCVKDFLDILSVLDQGIENAQNSVGASIVAFSQPVLEQNVSSHGQTATMAPISNDPVVQDGTQGDDTDISEEYHDLGLMCSQFIENLNQISDNGQTTTDRPQKVQLQAEVHQASASNMEIEIERAITPMVILPLPQHPYNNKDNLNAVDTEINDDEELMDLGGMSDDMEKAEESTKKDEKEQHPKSPKKGNASKPYTLKFRILKNMRLENKF